MENDVFSSIPHLDTAMDMEYMDELLLDGCWLETTDGSEFLNPNSSVSTGSFDPSSFIWPSPEANGIWNTYQNQISNQAETQKASFDESKDLASLNQRWWISPRTNPSFPSTSVMERLVQAVKYIKDFSRGNDSLIQLWVPVNRGGKRVLTTNDQPFEFNQNCLRLANYREISLSYQFRAEEDDSKDLVGLPGRVFLGRVPEWTPDVRFFKSEEYPRVSHAQNLDVRGTLAIPVFEQGSKMCLGVIEIVMTSRMLKLQPELETVCKALEAVNLRSSEVPTVQSVQRCDLSYQAALPEIQNLLRCACETHKLPLAQTWVSCHQQGKSGCRHSDENYIHCVSTVDEACYISDPTVQEFHEACSEHHLLKNQGVAGKAFLTNQPCFSPDITEFKKTEYPLSHHARMFGLHGSVAIRLRCIHTGSVDFVLEFFLPKNCQNLEEQKNMLNSLSIIIQQVSRSLRVVTNQELDEETGCLTSEVIETEEPFSTVENDNIIQKLRQGFDKAQPGAGRQKEGFEYGREGSVNESSFASVATSRTGEKRRSKVEKTITFDVLKQYFAGSLKDAAKSIGVCPTTLKRICRQHGIQRWPSRKIKKVGHSLQKIQRVIDSVQGVSGPLPIGSFYTNFPELAAPNLYQTNEEELPSSKPATDYPNPSVLQHERNHSKSPSSSCSQSSNSSQGCSSEMQANAWTFRKPGNEDPVFGDHSVIDAAAGVMKRVRSEAELHCSSIEETKMLPSNNHRCETSPENPNPEILLPEFPGKQIGLGFVQGGDNFMRIKITYGDEKIRFRMQNSWRLTDLSREISKRFDIDDICRYDLKYLDDDNEWVLLTCDADLEECIDVSRMLPSRTIKLLLQVSSHHLPERSSASRNTL